jgi:hypothetical protein
MANITLSSQEMQVLIELLEREIPSLREELHHTDDREYRAFLKEREGFMHAMLQRLRAQATEVTTSSDT